MNDSFETQKELHSDVTSHLHVLQDWKKPLPVKWLKKNDCFPLKMQKRINLVLFDRYDETPVHFSSVFSN